MATFAIEFSDGQWDETQPSIEADTIAEALTHAVSDLRDWITDGDWGIEGAAVDAWCTVTEEGCTHPQLGTDGACAECDATCSGTDVDAETEVCTDSECDLHGDAGDGETLRARVTVMVEPDHEALITQAGGDPNCDHHWTSEGEGGCDENPGEWLTGGTSMMFRSHCTECGLVRVENHTGSQRNPGECDTVEYRLPDSNED